MSDEVVIRAEGVGKKYILGHQFERERYVALRDVLMRTGKNAWRKVKDLAHGRFADSDSVEEFWALKDVDFEIKRGEVVGIIGRNGAGKSTLLKILSRITEPTEGCITIEGRLASLLEVGTGFHPELTGRENVFLNGTILGMTRAEIRRKFDEIVAFAEVERFLDTPIKRYSSGMYVRLAFAVAAHLEPEILVVDEVLAVGVAEFQKKCLGKMDEVAGNGRTVLFVSHNIGALLSICSSGLYLEAGRVKARGSIAEVADRYHAGFSSGARSIDPKAFSGPLKGVHFMSIDVNGRPALPTVAVSSEDEVEISIAGTSDKNLTGFAFALALFCEGTRVLSLHDEPKTLEAGSFEVRFFLPARFLRPGSYSVATGGKQVAGNDWTWGLDVANIEIYPIWNDRYRQDNIGVVNIARPPVRIGGVEGPAERQTGS